MKCVYSNGIELTKEQVIELSEITGSIEKFLSDLNKLAKNIFNLIKKCIINTKKEYKETYAHTRERIMRDQVIDRRPVINIIRNNC